MEEKKFQKVALFKALYQLDDPDDESEDISDISVMVRQSKTSSLSSCLVQQKPTCPSRMNYPIARTISAPLPLTSSNAPSKDTTQSSPILIVNRSIHDQGAIKSPVMLSRGFNTTSSKKAPTNKGKRKRGQSLEVISESQQIFKGLVFCRVFATYENLRFFANILHADFIPSNDIAPSRRFRIRKALERGALWAREWRTGITHVIVDNNLDYQDVLTFLRLPSLPVYTS